MRSSGSRTTACRGLIGATLVLLASPVRTTPTLAGPIDLAPKFEFGAEVHYVSHSLIHHEVHVDEANLDEKILVRTESGMTMRVTSVDADGSATIQCKLRYISISTDGAMPGIGELLDYDSHKPQAAASPLAPLFAGFVDHPVMVRVEATGKVIDFQGIKTGELVWDYAAGPVVSAAT